MGKEVVLRTPISKKDIAELRIGDRIFITGTMITARDAAHKRMIEYLAKGQTLPIKLNGSVVYHCGPLMRNINNQWYVVAAGPTTSMRMESFQGNIIKNYGVRIVVGKGGMGKNTINFMKKYKAVYGSFTGGAALLAASKIIKVKKVEWLDLGMPEALWIFDVRRFGPVIVSIDTQGRSLYEKTRNMQTGLREKLDLY